MTTTAQYTLASIATEGFSVRVAPRLVAAI